MTEEKQIYHTRVHHYYEGEGIRAYGDGTCTVTNRRMILRWDDGSLTLIPLNEIRTLSYIPPEGENPARLAIGHLGSRFATLLKCADAAQLSAVIKKAILPF